MAGKKRAEGWQLADFAAVYGLPPGPLDYTTFVRLSLHAERIRVQWASTFAAAIHAASSDEPLPDIWGDAVASSSEEGAEIAYSLNCARMAARAARRTSGGP